MRVIIVDDHGDTRAGYAEFLGVFGFDYAAGAAPACGEAIPMGGSHWECGCGGTGGTTCIGSHSAAFFACR